tara:strand:+ start:144 stop:1112 length:969 start_codon:yes stop_codon:yes gene_type:complete
MNILVTGAAGFLGSHLCDHFLNQGHTVTGIDNFFRGKRENLPDHGRFYFHELDLTQKTGDINDIVRAGDFDWVLHYAAINGTKYFYDIPTRVFDDNYKMTLNVLEACRGSSTVKKFGYASSSEVYGNCPVIPTPESESVILNVFEHRDSYAAAKAFGDFMTKLYCEEMGIEYLTFRIFNAYGPRMDNTEYGQVIPEFFRKALDPERFQLIGDGNQTRSFCYVEDHVKMIDAAMTKMSNEVVNIGNDELVTIMDLASRVCKIVGKNFDPEFLPPRSYDTQRRQPDLALIKKYYKESAKSLDAGLAMMHKSLLAKEVHKNAKPN